MLLLIHLSIYNISWLTNLKSGETNSWLIHAENPWLQILNGQLVSYGILRDDVFAAKEPAKKKL